ncbi:unnamed protein product [Closterium sp. Naga37s-1]|nr:unnamed protein product [Closterium sp. Naga37s-1]
MTSYLFARFMSRRVSDVKRVSSVRGMLVGAAAEQLAPLQAAKTGIRRLHQSVTPATPVKPSSSSSRRFSWFFPALVGALAGGATAVAALHSPHTEAPSRLPLSSAHHAQSGGPLSATPLFGSRESAPAYSTHASLPLSPLEATTASPRAGFIPRLVLTADASPTAIPFPGPESPPLPTPPPHGSLPAPRSVVEGIKRLLPGEGEPGGKAEAQAEGGKGLKDGEGEWTKEVESRGMFSGQAMGSGAIIRADGLILTNAHVVAEMVDPFASSAPYWSSRATLQVTLQDGRTFDGHVLSFDSLSDIALVKVLPHVLVPSPTCLTTLLSPASTPVGQHLAMPLVLPPSLFSTTLTSLCSLLLESNCCALRVAVHPCCLPLLSSSHPLHCPTQVSAPSPLPVVKLGSSKALRPGDWVVALGSPLHLSNTVTAGIVRCAHPFTAAECAFTCCLGLQVLPAPSGAAGWGFSCVDRKGTELGLRGGRMDYIQTDAAINAGNSGGPLVNLDGEVVGINNMKALAADGVSFAIPIDSAVLILDQLSRHGRVVRPFVGIKMLELNASIAAQLRDRDPSFPPVDAGILVPQVIPGSPAARGGLQPGDVIVEFAGQPVTSSRQVLDLLGDKVGVKVPLVVKRAHGKTVTLTIVTEEATPDT